MRDYSNYHSVSANDKMLYDGKELFKKSLSSLEGHDVLINGVEKRAVIQSKFLNHLRGDIKTIMTEMDELSMGDIITHNGDNWLTIFLTDDYIAYLKGAMQRCNEKLRWINHNGESIEVDCVISKSPLDRIFLKSTSHDIPIVDGFVYIVCPLNEFTSTIQHKQRFIMGSQVYEITGVDDVTNVIKEKGVIQFIARYGISKSSDNVENKIADNSHLYGQNSVPPEDGEPSSGNNGGGWW